MNLICLLCASVICIAPLSALCTYYKQDILQNNQQGEVTLHPAPIISHTPAFWKERETGVESGRQRGRAGERSKT